MKSKLAELPTDENIEQVLVGVFKHYKKHFGSNLRDNYRTEPVKLNLRSNVDFYIKNYETLTEDEKVKIWKQCLKLADLYLKYSKEEYFNPFYRKQPSTEDYKCMKHLFGFTDLKVHSKSRFDDNIGQDHIIKIELPKFEIKSKEELKSEDSLSNKQVRLFD